jgi:hypothetical protein
MLNAEDAFELVLPFCIREFEFDPIPFKFDDSEEPFIDVLLLLLLGNVLDNELLLVVVVDVVVLLFFNVGVFEAEAEEEEEDMLRLLILFNFEKCCDCSAIMFSRVGCFSP